MSGWISKASWEFREPFRRPFVVAMSLGKEEVEVKVLQQWEQQWTGTLQPLVERYPFSATATEEVEPSELQLLHPKGAFWSFAHRVVAPLCTVEGKTWDFRGPLKNRLEAPPHMLETINQLAELSGVLWNAEGQPQPLTLQVLPQPLPPSPISDSFVTMSYLKCGKTTTFSFNQNPTWQEFPLKWWEPQPASIGLEFRTPVSEERDYRAQEISRSFWSCFRLLESASAKDGRQWTWRLMRKQGGSPQVIEVRFGVRGEPWIPFRRLSPRACVIQENGWAWPRCCLGLAASPASSPSTSAPPPTSTSPGPSTWWFVRWIPRPTSARRMTRSCPRSSCRMSR